MPSVIPVSMLNLIPGRQFGFNHGLHSRDRSNISKYYAALFVGPYILCHLSGNAKIAGMSTDLHLVGLEYNTAAAVFYVCFFLLAF